MPKYCSKCGNEINDNATFCAKCGNSMGSTSPLTNQQGTNANTQQGGSFVDKMPKFIKDNITTQKENIRMCGNVILNKREKQIALIGLLLTIIVNHISPFYIGDEGMSGFRWLINGGFGAVFQIMYIISRLAGWFFTVKALMQFTDYRDNVSKFWENTLIAYFLHGFMNTLYFIIMTFGVIFSLGDLTEKDKDEFGIGVGLFGTIVFIASAIGFFKTIVVRNEINNTDDSRMCIYIMRYDEKFPMQPYKFGKKDNMYINDANGEMFFRDKDKLTSILNGTQYNIIKK